MAENQGAQAVHTAMGTELMHRAYGRLARRAIRAAQREALRLERLLSRFDQRSEISRINRCAGQSCVKVSRETFSLLKTAQEISFLSGGAFDITIGPLVKLWDYKHAASAPDAAAIQAALSLVGFGNLALCAQSCTAGLAQAGQVIDLGGIGKGYASDRAIAVFQRYGIASAFTNIGGNVSTLGAKPDGTPWQVGILHPRQEDSILGTVGVCGQAVVTSGDYERYFTDREGNRWHHIINPATGYPAQSGIISATVVADSALQADALSTALFVLGMEKGRKLLDHYPTVQALLVDDDMKVHVSKGLRNIFTPACGIQAEELP